MSDKFNLSLDMTLREVMQNMVHGEVFTICKHPKNEMTLGFFEMQIVSRRKMGENSVRRHIRSGRARAYPPSMDG